MRGMNRIKIKITKKDIAKNKISVVYVRSIVDLKLMLMLEFILTESMLLVKYDVLNE